MRLNKVLTSKTSRHNCGQLLSVVLVYLRMHGISHVLGCSTYLSVWWEEGALCVEHLVVFLFPPFPILCSPLCISVMGACLPGWGLMAGHGYQVLPAIGAVSMLELAAYSGGSRMSWAPNLHIVTQLFMILFSSLWDNFINLFL